MRMMIQGYNDRELSKQGILLQYNTRDRTVESRFRSLQQTTLQGGLYVLLRRYVLSTYLSNAVTEHIGHPVDYSSVCLPSLNQESTVILKRSWLHQHCCPVVPSCPPTHFQFDE